jgi:hypothetical protein
MKALFARQNIDFSRLILKGRAGYKSIIMTKHKPSLEIREFAQYYLNGLRLSAFLNPDSVREMKREDKPLY